MRPTIITFTTLAAIWVTADQGMSNAAVVAWLIVLIAVVSSCAVPLIAWIEGRNAYDRDTIRQQMHADRRDPGDWTDAQWQGFEDAVRERGGRRG